MRYISRCSKQASIFLLISKFWKTSKTSIFQANNPEKAPSEINFRSWCDFEGTWLLHYQSLIFKFENGMHTKNFKNNQNFKIFWNSYNFCKFILVFFIPSLLIHSTLTETRLSEFHQKNIGDQKSCEKISSELFLVI